MIFAQNTLLFFGQLGLLIAQVYREFVWRKLDWKAIIYQVYQIGIKSLPVVLVTSLSIGMVMALQFGISLEKFGGSLYIPKIVSLSVIKEFGPVFTSIMVAARIGSGMTSEIGSMVVTDQINAIRALGTSPITKVVIPRVVACFIALPILAVIANTVGVAGGLIVGIMDLKLDAQFYIQKIYDTVQVADYLSGVGKTFFFSLIISIVACFYGLNVSVGTKEVGFATTKSVVTSCVAIMIGDYFLTKLFWMIQLWL